MGSEGVCGLEIVSKHFDHTTILPRQLQGYKPEGAYFNATLVMLLSYKHAITTDNYT